jgi:hypothetical protein
MAPSPELKLLDESDGTSERYLWLEDWFFAGDRPLMLFSLRQLRKDGLVSIERSGEPVPDWQLEAWQRAPALAETNAALSEVVITGTPGNEAPR